MASPIAQCQQKEGQCSPARHLSHLPRRPLIGAGQYCQNVSCRNCNSCKPRVAHPHGATDVSVEVSRGSGGNSGGSSFIGKGGGTFLGHSEIRADDFEDVGLVKTVDSALVCLLIFMVDAIGVFADHKHIIDLSLPILGLELVTDGFAGVEEEVCFGFAEGSDASFLSSCNNGLIFLVAQTSGMFGTDSYAKFGA